MKDKHMSDEFVQVNVKLTKKQKSILENQCINLSSLSRKLFQDKIDAEGWE